MVSCWTAQIYEVSNDKALTAYTDLAHNHADHWEFWKHHLFYSLEDGMGFMQANPHT